MTRTATAAACKAVWHGTGWAYTKYKCRCPEAKMEKQSMRKVLLSRTLGNTSVGKHARHRDVDPLAVDIACTGQRLTRLGGTERLLAVRRLTDAGLTAVETARRVGLAPRSVYRIRQRIREMAA